MQVIDRGTGPAVVLIPGIQGRWEWMMPAVDALATRCRVITFSLGDEPSSGFAADPALGIENYLAQIAAVMDRLQLADAVLVGVSYSGALAAEFAARHPERVRGLVLVSALPTDWRPDARARFYLRAPLLLSPVFMVDAPVRTYREVRAALPRLTDRAAFSIGQLARATRYFLSPTRMAARIQWFADFAFSDPGQLPQPVLVITGEDGLDRVVSPRLTARYVAAIPQARHRVIAATGHLGLITKPRAFADLVAQFLKELADDVRRISA